MTYDARQIANEAAENGEDPLRTVVFQALGAASVCWENPGGAGVFDSTRARQIGDSLVAYLTDGRPT